MHASFLVLGAFATFLRPLAAQAETFEARPGDDVEQVIRGLQAGDQLILHDGLYSLTATTVPPFGAFRFAIAGTSTAPIVIRAADGAHPNFFRGNADQNVWDIAAVHTRISGLRFSGGSIGLRIEGATDLTIEDCEIVGTESSGIVASLGTVVFDGLRIVRTRIHEAGDSGILFGCLNDECRAINSVIERNHIYDIVGQGVRLREGGHGNKVIDNVVHDTGSVCVLTYGTAGNGPRHSIEGNLLFRCGDHGIQAAADAEISNNIILSSAVDGIVMRPYSPSNPAKGSTPSNLSIRHNTVLNSDHNAIVLQGTGGSVIIANNALYAPSGAAIAILDASPGLTSRGNVGLGIIASAGVNEGDVAADFLNANLAGTLPNDVFPAPGGALVGTGEPGDVLATDFNGTPRTEPDVGAYAFDPLGNPGWILRETFKGSEVLPPVDGGIDGGSSDGGVDDGATTDAGTDGGSDDTGFEDAGLDDASTSDGSSNDTGTSDVPTDAEATDAAATTDDASSGTGDAGSQQADSDGAIEGGDPIGPRIDEDDTGSGGCGCRALHSSGHSSGGTDGGGGTEGLLFTWLFAVVGVRGLRRRLCKHGADRAH